MIVLFYCLAAFKEKKHLGRPVRVGFDSKHCSIVQEQLCNTLDYSGELCWEMVHLKVLLVLADHHRKEPHKVNQNRNICMVTEI